MDRNGYNSYIPQTRQTARSMAAEPVVPLPNVGEGGPVYSGGAEPVVPLPNPGEGGPVYPGKIGRAHV